MKTYQFFYKNIEVSVDAEDLNDAKNKAESEIIDQFFDNCTTEIYLEEDFEEPVREGN